LNNRPLIVNSFSHRQRSLYPVTTEGRLFDVRGIPTTPRHKRTAYNGTSRELRAHPMADENVRRRVGDITSTIRSHLAGIDERGEKVNEVWAGLGCELGKNWSVALRWPKGNLEVRCRELPWS